MMSASAILLPLLLAAGSVVLVAPAASAVDYDPCIGLSRGDHQSDDYECVGLYLPPGGTPCVGVYHNHPNPGHPDGCTGLQQVSAVIGKVGVRVLLP